MKAARAALGVALACLLPACLTTQPYEDENPDCYWDGNFGETGELSEGPTLQIGDGEGESFVAWQSEELLDTVGGPQGLQMLTPTLRLVGAGAGLEADEEPCLSVYIKLIRPGNDFENTPAEGEAANAYLFRVDGDDLWAGPIWTPFDDLFVNGGYALRATVRSDEWSSAVELPIFIEQ